ncbi:MAG: bifunctional acetate--CoA ligase family protein/GNAT family N-acetyltransferase [Rhodanobacteraceae bacterium]|nr:bifunctional acetate--CoA ligase family protein/GNAT family N-acetyltransferase [Rhodanobacteraceae bacterium]
MDSRPLDRLLAPRSLALIGASDQPDSLGTAFTRQALDADFGGAVHLVNRHRDEVFGRECLRDASALPEGIDLALVLTPWASVAEIIETLARRGCGGAVVVGIATESGWPWASRATLLKRLQKQVAKTGLRIIGPASQGLTLARLGLNLSLCPALPPPGGIGFVSTSGAVAGVIADWAATRGVGMSALVSLGDQVDVDIADCLDWFARDAATRAVLLHLEQLPQARRLLSAARALAFRKPVVVLKPHTLGFAPGDPLAALSNEVHRAAFARAGMLQAQDLEEFCAAANVDLPAWPHAGQRFYIAGNGGALGALAADAVLDSGGSLAQPSAETLRQLQSLLPAGSAVSNPLDLMRDAGPERYAVAGTALAHDSGSDVVLLLHHPTSFSSGSEIARALNPVPQGEALVLAAFAGAEQQQARRILGERGIAAFPTPEAAVRAYGLNRRYFQQKSELMQTPPPLLRWPGLDAERIASSLLRLGGDPRRLGAGLLAEIGVDIELDERRAGLLPSIGLRCHAELGPYAVACSRGRRHIECLPLDRLRVDRLIERGWDGVEIPADTRATLHGHLLRIAELMVARPEIQRIEFEGVTGGSSGELLAHLVFDWQPGSERAATAFAPFPWSLAMPLTLADGTALLLRAIRAEDEPQLQAGFTQLSPEEVRMRFLYPLKALTHDLAARLTQLDYDREIALVLADHEPPGQAKLYGVVRASFDPAQRSAEFAIVIPKQLGGQGLGTRLLQRIIELCRAAGMRRMHGDTLPENQAMRALARKCGFHEELKDQLIRLTLDL